MFAELTPEFLATPEGTEAQRILRACVHCGFCLATCPTYQLLGDELDSPRGRIYLMKGMFEGQPVSALTQHHLDRCLTCRACETTCPSGVQYGKLVDIGRHYLEQRQPRSTQDHFKRTALKTVLTSPWLFKPLLAAGRLVRGLLPEPLRNKLPMRQPAGLRPVSKHSRRMLLLEGCVQPDLAPNINAATARVLDRLGITVFSVPKAGCCGALAHHLADESAARLAMQRNIDAWWPHVTQGVEAIVMTASGCGTQVKDYGYQLRHDPLYADRASQISALTRDLSEVLLKELEGTPEERRLSLQSLGLRSASSAPRIAFHAPCTLQHGQKLKGVVEQLLTAAGAQLTPVPDAHLCCGSAGTYSLLQPELSHQLQVNKLKALTSGHPELILTANIGCLTHLAAGSSTPVRHWVEWLDTCLTPSGM